MSCTPLRVLCACARDRLRASPPDQLRPVGKERAGLGEWGTSASSRSPESWAGARVHQSGNSDGEERGTEGGGEGSGGKEGGGAEKAD